MSNPAIWSTQATPLARLAGAVVLILGSFSVLYFLITLALGGSAWNLPACLCLALLACLVGLRLRRTHDSAECVLSYCPESSAFTVAGHDGRLELVRVWQAPGWVTLGLREQGESHRVLHLVLWKSAIPAPSWSELILRIGEGPLPGKRPQNKENP